MDNEECDGKQKEDEPTTDYTCQTTCRTNDQRSTLEVDSDVGYNDNNENPILSPMTIDSHSTMDPSSCVQVAVRVRPLLALEGDDECCVQVLHNGMSHAGRKGPANSIQIGGSSGPQYTFDQVFDMEATQVQVYESRVATLIGSCLAGYNATILAYGQTGSGVSLYNFSLHHVHYRKLTSRILHGDDIYRKHILSWAQIQQRQSQTSMTQELYRER
jgi:hypothetical protein